MTGTPTREQIEARLEELRLAGRDLAHTRTVNVDAVYRLVNGDPAITLGIAAVHEQLRNGEMNAQQVLDRISGMTGCSSDLRYREGRGYISPRATYEGLRAAAAVLRDAVARRSSFIFATGHPASMLAAYEDLASWVRGRGCEVIAEPPGEIEAGGLKLERGGSVYVVTSNGEPVHTHMHEHMQQLLERVPRPEIAVADHGFAGAVLNLGIPAVCVMDTNDPGVVIAADLGAPITVIPVNDNAPSEAVREMARMICTLAEAASS